MRMFLCPETTRLDLDRIERITLHRQAFRREKLAAHLAFQTEMEVGEALKILAVAPLTGAPLADIVTHQGQEAGLEPGNFTQRDLWGALGNT